MNKKEMCKEALTAYFVEEPSYCEPYGNGLINDTFLVICDEKRYILQRVNTSVFPRPKELMENILGVTEHIRNKVTRVGGDVERCTLQVLQTLSGESWFVDSSERFWRLYAFTERTVTLEKVQSAEQFYSCAKAFGGFQRMLSDYPAHLLHEPLSGLHDTPWRYENLMVAAREDVCGRICEVEAELAFVIQRRDFCRVLADANLPLRVTHNDTKLNNILFDEESGEPVCVIDLDTVMPGYAVTDFGDSVRAGACTAGDDETDLSKVQLDLSLFAAFTKGFLQGCDGSLTDREIALLPEAAILIALELGMRFLTDYLQGDTYFKTRRPRQNLDRARIQLALAKDMESKREQMHAIVQSIVLAQDAE